jgi:uncharacterized membrane protein YraQ (UPF0718 family)
LNRNLADIQAARRGCYNQGANVELDALTTLLFELGNTMVADLYSGLVLIAVMAWLQVVQLGPYVIAGIVLAALLGQFDLARRWSQHLTNGKPANVLSAACLGGLSPLSTFGTVPVLAQLLRQGASPGPVLAFLAASSMLNPQLVFLVWGGLSARLALMQIAGVLSLSLLVGLAAAHLRPTLLLNSTTLATEGVRDLSPRCFTWMGLLRDTLRLTEWIGLTFVVGVILGAALKVWSAAWMTQLLPASRWAGVTLAAVLGIPLYTCGGSAVPVLAGLTRMGLSQSAALAFLLSGPATRVNALAAMGSLLNRKALMAYSFYIVGGAIVIGLVLPP